MDFQMYALNGLSGEPIQAQPKCQFCGEALSEAPNTRGAHDACTERAQEFMADASYDWAGHD